MSDEVTVMVVEQRGYVRQLRLKYNSQEEDILNETKAKPFNISKQLVMQAYEIVKENAGAAGIDGQTLHDFDKNLKDKLYKLWNRLSSGSYFPPPVKGVQIEKKTGGYRNLSVPTVSDRIAQTVVKLAFEPSVEAIFLTDSYGYRPNKSALDAVGITRERCWRYAWLVEYDIKGFFDNLDWELLMKAVKKHTNCQWIILYIERWLKTPTQLADGTLQERTKGIMQGGVISPVLSNLYLHYVYDLWMKKNYPTIPWCRYADDGLAHCKTKQEAEQLLVILRQRFKECGLALHSEKTKIIYCKNDKRKEAYPEIKFDFLGYCFRPRSVMNSKTQEMFTAFVPAVSPSSKKAMQAKTREKKIYRRSDLSLNDIASMCNPMLTGWINYYGKYNRTELIPVMNHFNKTLVSWAMRKYKTLRGHKTETTIFLQGIAKREPKLFAHWKVGLVGTFAL